MAKKERDKRGVGDECLGTGHFKMWTEEEEGFSGVGGGRGEADGRRREDRSDGEKPGSPAGKVGSRNLVGLPAIRGALNLKSGQVNNDQHGTKAFKGQAAGSSLGTFLGSEASLSAFPTLYLFPVKSVLSSQAGETKQNVPKALVGLPPPFSPTLAPTERCCMNKK